ncbi:MAG TPA: aldehyde dehydrogenase family protein [Pyrinomonadaceae bacterium]|nr:aldehyde dehydrogenase family protein [Pyrinomonadaceae bacterium]
MNKKILICGEWRESAESFAVKNPFTNEQIAEVFSIDGNELEEVISAAEIGAKEMQKLARFEVAKGLREIADQIEKRKNEFAETITLESAKPIKLALDEVERGISTFHFAAGEVEKFVGEVVAVDAFETGKGKTAYTKRIPRGVIYGITPFNFPLNLVAHKIAPALASGNAIIIKPSPRTPLTSLLLGEVFIESGLPKNALQIAPMDTKYIDKIYSDERLNMVSFTGSAEIGWQIKSKANKKFVTLELGGNAPVIVDETADFNKSVERTVFGAFSYSGQVCISVQRVFVHEKIFENWTEKFIEKAQNLKKGNPFAETTEISVMIDEKAAERAQKWINEAETNGAEVLCGNNREKSFLDATVLTNTNAEMRVVSEEIFAPVVVVEKFSDFEEAVSMANNSKFGLQAGVFTNNLRNAEFAAENLETGGVIINDIPTFRVDNMPYGGVKNSGFGREGVHYTMEEMSEIRLVVINS